LEKVTELWRKLHNQEFHNLYSSADIIRIIKSKWMKLSGHVDAREKRNAYKVLTGKPEANGLFGR
jgi:hypothetical protein